jgi:hypothetical protein
MAALEAAVAAVVCTDVERTFLAALLPVVGGEFGSEPFTTAEACRRPSVSVVVGARSTTSLGQLFARAAGFIFGGYELAQLGNHGSRALWRVWRRAG